MVAAGIYSSTVANTMENTGTTMMIQHYQHVLTRQKNRRSKPHQMCPHVPTNEWVPQKFQLLKSDNKALESFEKEACFEPKALSR